MSTDSGTQERVRVLLVDDDPDDHLIIREMLSEIRTTRYLIDAVDTYDKGLERAVSGEYDVYIVDYRLGPKTGLELFHELAGRGDPTPLILLTGQGDHRTDVEAMESGVADYLVKSQITSPLLERSVRFAIARREMQGQIVRQDRLASIGLLASSLAHEIGTPLGVIRGRAEYLALKEGSRPLVKDTAQIIVNEIDRLSKLIRSLLTLARGEDRGGVEPIEIEHTLHDISGLIGHELERKGIRFELQIPPGTKVMAAAGPLHQVLLNLLVNAVHAIEAADAGPSDGHRIRVAASEVQGRVRVEIEDTGCGISPENMRRLFTPFFTTKDIGKGTGLGLATSYRILEAWGGRIDVVSELGRGTTFIVDLATAARSQ